MHLHAATDTTLWDITSGIREIAGSTAYREIVELGIVEHVEDAVLDAINEALNGTEFDGMTVNKKFIDWTYDGERIELSDIKDSLREIVNTLPLGELIGNEINEAMLING